jgi:hypothetical protein
MMRTNTFVLGVLLLAGCTGLNVTPRDDADVSPFDAPYDGADAGVGGATGQAGVGGGGNGGASSAGGVGGDGVGGIGGGGRGGGAGGGAGHAMGGAGGQVPTGGRSGAGGASGGSQGGGHGGGGGAHGAGGATASCPASTTSPCSPNATDTAEEACCSTGKRTRSRKCDPVTCQWGSYGAWSSCSVAAACTPGDTSACTNKDPCGNRVCSSACAWGACVPKSGNACLCIRDGHTDCGSNYRCGTGSHDGDWQFCLSDTCQWSTEWAACSSSNCEC